MAVETLSHLTRRTRRPEFCSATWFPTVFHDAPVLFAITTIPDGRYLEVNKAFLRALGFSREEVVGHTSIELDVWHDPDERARLVSRLLERGSFQNEEVTIRKKNGECFVGLFSGAIVEMGGDQLLFTLASDISRQKQAEKQLSQAREILERTLREQTKLIGNEQKEQKRVREELASVRQVLMQRNRQAMLGQMINTIVHQWQQPLNTLGLIIQDISLDLAERADLPHSDLDRAMHLIFYMAETAEVFKSFLKPDEGEREFSINDAIERSLILFEAMHGRENIGIDYSEAKQQFVAHGNSNEFCQALLNILKNGRDVLLSRRIPDPRIHIGLEARCGEAIVTVFDNGGGIAEDDIERIFDSYFTTKPNDAGTGIGLCITKTIIENRMGGRVHACNQNGGARFVVTVPCAERESPA